jgi:hypothetical protein
VLHLFFIQSGSIAVSKQQGLQQELPGTGPLGPMLFSFLQTALPCCTTVLLLSPDLAGLHALGVEFPVLVAKTRLGIRNNNLAMISQYGVIAQAALLQVTRTACSRQLTNNTFVYF